MQYDLVIGKGDVQVRGNSIAGGFDNPESMTPPATKDGDWTFSNFTASGELRITIVVPDCDWWRTEFTFQKSTGSIYYRNTDIPNNWLETMGEDYSVTGEPGKTLKVNFEKGTASLE